MFFFRPALLWSTFQNKYSFLEQTEHLINLWDIIKFTGLAKVYPGIFVGEEKWKKTIKSFIKIFLCVVKFTLFNNIWKVSKSGEGERIFLHSHWLGFFNTSLSHKKLHTIMCDHEKHWKTSIVSQRNNDSV